MLAEPHDARHIVPGLAESADSIAYYTSVDSEFLFPDLLVPCFHNLSHPSTGPAEGVTKNRIQLGQRKDDCVIRIKKVSWEATGPDGTKTVHGIRVRLILKGDQLLRAFREFCKCARINKTPHLVAFPMSAVARVHQTMMSQLVGTYLPVPPEWRDKSLGKPSHMQRPWPWYPS